MSHGAVNLQFWSADTVTLPWIVPFRSPLLQLCPGCPPSKRGSASESPVTVGSRQPNVVSVPGMGVQGGGGPSCARIRFVLMMCGATVGSGRHELEIRGSAAEGQGRKLLVV